jgi:poly-gamma-glutamate synthesis protein (capsule biosynthesis protein)
VALLGWNTTDNPIDRDNAAAAIRDAKQSATYTVAFLHWGTEYTPRPSAAQTELAHWLIDQGVDAVIGAHPHWTQSLEIYNGKPIAYSLGNAVFDQEWSAETQQGLLAGLVLGPSAPALHLFPIQLNQSVPKLLTGAARDARLDYLSSISDPALSDAIQEGILR